MKRAVVTLGIGAVLLLALLALHAASGPHEERRRLLHQATPWILVAATTAAALVAWWRPFLPLAWGWSAVYIGGGLSYLEGNARTPFLHEVLWCGLVLAGRFVARRLERTVSRGRPTGRWTDEGTTTP